MRKTYLTPQISTKLDLPLMQHFSEDSRTSLCLDCANACCGCSWSRSFVPVSGWVAEPQKINNRYGNTVVQLDSFRVISCPCFKHDRPHKLGYKVTKQILSKLVGGSIRSVSYDKLFQLNKRIRQLDKNLVVNYLREPTEDNGNYYINYVENHV